MLTLDIVNSSDAHAFVALLGGIFEHSPWVAQRAWTDKPFDSLAALHGAMLNVVRLAPREAQRALVCAHPELAGREASSGSLTADSSSEQGRLGFTALNRDELERIATINRAYREKFGFPCIVALRLYQDRESVVAEMERRLSNDADSELTHALEQIGHITRGRLEKLFTPEHSWAN
jgi:2-oxo-4-hydroxy-4-carboxy-5-ureidoimidazoline decarboxylase